MTVWQYNLPAGGLEPGETLTEAVRREAKEEACAEVEVGPVGFVLPDHPDPHQVGVKWIPISELHDIQLYPEINKDIIDYHQG